MNAAAAPVINQIPINNDCSDEGLKQSSLGDNVSGASANWFMSK
jgi:hypothetical protein